MAKPPLPPFELLVLTAGNLIDGTVPGETDLFFLKPNEMSEPLHLSNVRIESTLPAGSSTHTCTNYFLIRTNALAYIPRKDFMQFPSYSGWKMYKDSIDGTFQLGPYRMTGRLMTMRHFLSGDLPIFDVRFESQVPGAQWRGIDAPFALINTYKLQGWEAD